MGFQGSCYGLMACLFLISGRWFDLLAWEKRWMHGMAPSFVGGLQVIVTELPLISGRG